jgi:hypothetical protein
MLPIVEQDIKFRRIMRKSTTMTDIKEIAAKVLTAIRRLPLQPVM